jgi:hypothetical protein
VEQEEASQTAWNDIICVMPNQAEGNKCHQTDDYPVFAYVIRVIAPGSEVLQNQTLQRHAADLIGAVNRSFGTQTMGNGHQFSHFCYILALVTTPNPILHR